LDKPKGENLSYFREMKACTERMLETKDGKFIELFLERLTGYSTPNIGVQNADKTEGGRRVTCFLKWIRDVNPESLENEMMMIQEKGGWFA
jgi:hypothetical protein